MEINFDQMIGSEMAVYERYKSAYEKKFPMPEKPNVRLMQALGWQFIFVLIQGVFAILLAALRTGKMFYVASGDTWVSVPEAVSAIIAVEFGIVVFAAIRAEAANRGSSDMVINISTKKLWLGEIIGIIISVIAGLGVSFDGFGIDIKNFEYALSITMGVGASVIAAVSGEIIGTVLARFGNIQDVAKKEYVNGVAAWVDGMNAAWEKSPERKIVRDQIETQKQVLEAERRNIVRSVSERTSNEQRTNEENGSVGSGGVLRTPNEQRTNVLPHAIRPEFNEQSLAPAAKQIFEYLDKNSTATTAPTVSDIVASLGVAKSYASTTAKKWKEVRGWPGVEEFPVPETNGAPQ